MLGSVVKCSGVCDSELTRILRTKQKCKISEYFEVHI